MTAAELDALEALANAATPGPWKQDWTWIGKHEMPMSIEANDGLRVIGTLDEWEDQCPADSRFIAAARDAVPRLIARVRELEAEAAASCAWCGNSTRRRDE